MMKQQIYLQEFFDDQLDQSGEDWLFQEMAANRSLRQDLKLGISMKLAFARNSAANAPSPELTNNLMAKLPFGEVATSAEPLAATASGFWNSNFSRVATHLLSAGIAFIIAYLCLPTKETYIDRVVDSKPKSVQNFASNNSGNRNSIPMPSSSEAKSSKLLKSKIPSNFNIHYPVYDDKITNNSSQSEQNVREEAFSEPSLETFSFNRSASNTKILNYIDVAPSGKTNLRFHTYTPDFEISDLNRESDFNSKFSIEASGGFNSPLKNAPDELKNIREDFLLNKSLTLSYALSPNFDLFVECGKDRVYQEYTDYSAPLKLINYRQYPKNFWGGAGFKYFLPSFGSLEPYAGLSGGFGEVGPYAKMLGGFEYRINSLFSLNLRATFSEYFYKFDSKLCASPKASIEYGVKLHL
jgi:hypothetical protein